MYDFASLQCRAEEWYKNHAIKIPRDIDLKETTRNPSHDMPHNKTEETSNQQSFQIVTPGIPPHTGKCSFCSPLKQIKRVNAWQADGCWMVRLAIRNAKSEGLNSCRKFSNGCSRTVTRLKIFLNKWGWMCKQSHNMSRNDGSEILLPLKFSYLDAGSV